MKRFMGMAILLFGFFSAQASAQRYLVFPQLATGSGWSCDLFFNDPVAVNTGSIKLFFYNNEGIPIVVPTNIGTASSFDFPLVAGGTKVIKIQPTTTTLEGYIVIQYPAPAPVRASEIFRYEQNGVVLAEVGVPQQETANHYSFPVEVNSAEGINTGVALANPVEFNSGRPVIQTVILTLIQLDGSVKAVATITLQPGQHIASYLNNKLFFADIDNFVGTLSISSPFGIGVLALRQDREAYGAIATDYGPVVAPFALTGTGTPLQEPNNTPAQAIPIDSSTLFSGTMEAGGDVDYVKFTSVKNGILSVLADSQSIFFNPVLEVYDGSFNLIAENDDIGYSPQLSFVNDAYIQAVLPETGTYYIAVKDKFGGAASGSKYTLSIKFP
jgi:hypothetical protein